MPMRQLRRCDFCGGDAAGVYEVLPPELSPTEAEQQRLVLCSDCAGTLETVIDPLLERLGIEADEGASAADGATGAPDPEDRPEAPEPRDRKTADASSTGTETMPEKPSVRAKNTVSDGPDEASDKTNRSQADDSAFGAGSGSGPIECGTSDSDDDTANDSERSPSGPLRDGATRADPPTDADPSTGAGPLDDTDQTPTGTTASEPAATGSSAEVGADNRDADNADATTTDPDGAADGADATGSGNVGEEPEDFRTVMRLLGNREFPVDRDTIIELAASAYKLDEEHVRRVLDYAVDRGVIAEDGHTLRRD